MAAEYVNPKYAAMLRALQAARREAARTGREAPVRAFLSTPRPTGK